MLLLLVPFHKETENWIFLFWPCLVACGIKFPWLGSKPLPSAWEACSLNYWTAKEVSRIRRIDLTNAILVWHTPWTVFQCFALLPTKNLTHKSNLNHHFKSTSHISLFIGGIVDQFDQCSSCNTFHITQVKIMSWDFTGGPVADTLSSQCKGAGFHPWSGD